MAVQPLAISFDDIYVGRGTLDMSFHPGLKSLHGRSVILSGVLAPTHGHHGDGGTHGAEIAPVVIMDEAGRCPDCSPAPVATVHIAGLGELPNDHVPGQTTLTLQGTLEFCFAVDASGNASFVRLTSARVVA